MSFCREALEVELTEPSGSTPVPPQTTGAAAPPPTQEARVATPPPTQTAPEQTTARVSDPVVQDSNTERSPPTTEQNQPPKSPPPQVQQPQQMDSQKKKELLLKEQRKLKQTQLPRKNPAAPAYIAVTPPAKDKHAATSFLYALTSDRRVTGD